MPRFEVPGEWMGIMPRDYLQPRRSKGVTGERIKGPCYSTTGPGVRDGHAYHPYLPVCPAGKDSWGQGNLSSSRMLIVRQRLRRQIDPAPLTNGSSFRDYSIQVLYGLLVNQISQGEHSPASARD